MPLYGYFLRRTRNDIVLIKGKNDFSPYCPNFISAHTSLLRRSYQRKVYPNAASSSSSSPLSALDSPSDGCADDSMVLTVWKKSLIFNYVGFTVFDSHENLFYHVDNYTSSNKDQITLMDAHGNTVLTIRRKKLSLGDTWMVFDGEAAENLQLLVRKNVNPLNPRCLAHVSSAVDGYQMKIVLYRIEGSYGQRCCAVYDEKRRRVAEIKQKELIQKQRRFVCGLI